VLNLDRTLNGTVVLQRVVLGKEGGGLRSETQQPASHGDTGEGCGERLAGRSHIVHTITVKSEEILLQHKFPVPRKQKSLRVGSSNI
jgi:hypothetical protein